MAYFYRGADREQLFLMPMSMREWLSDLYQWVAPRAWHAEMLSGAG